MNEKKSGSPASTTLICGLMLLAGCGGGGGGGGSNPPSGPPTPPTDTTAPTVSIAAPANGTITNGASVTVTGTAADGGGVASVTVNGAAATSSNGFANWTALVALTPGPNSLVATARDSSGNLANASVSVTSDLTAPTATLGFPPAAALTDATELAVTGTASDNVRLGAVTVNGVAATSADNFATWRVRVPLAAGANTITVSATDAAGNVATAAATRTVTRRAQPPFLYPFDAALDPATNQLWVLDVVAHSLSRISVATGVRTVVSDATHGLGTPFLQPAFLALHPNGTDIYVTDQVAAALYRVNRNTGDRTVVSDASTGGGVALKFPQGIVLDTDNNTALVVDNTIQALLAISLTSGARTIVSDNTMPGTRMLTPRSLAFDSKRHRFLVGDSAAQRIFAIDVLGNHTDATNWSNAAAGPPMTGLRDITYDPATDTIYALIRGSSTAQGTLTPQFMFAIDATSGTRTRLTYSAEGSDTGLTSVHGFEFDPVARAFYVTDDLPGRIVRAPLTDASTIGARTAFFASDYSLGTGPMFAEPSAVVLANNGQRAFVAHSFGTSITSVDIASGARAEFVTSPLLLFTGDLVASDDGATLFTTNSSTSTIVKIAVATATATVLSDATFSPGYAASRPLGLAYDAPGKRLFGLTNLDVFAVDLASGLQQRVSSNSDGKAPNFVQSSKLALDAANARLLVGGQDLVAVAIADGARTTISASPRGQGRLLSKIVVEGNGATSLVNDADGIYRVRHSDGGRTLVSGPGAGSGPDCIANGLAADFARGVYYATCANALLAIEAASGDRVIISQ